MRPLPQPLPIRTTAARSPTVPPRPRRDSAEFSLGYDAYVVVPPLAPDPPDRSRRLAEWSRRVRRLLGDASFRVLAAVALAGFAWLCERGAT